MYGRARVRARLRTRALACLQLLLSRDSRRHVQRRLAARRVNGRLTVPDRTWLLRSAVRQRALIAVPTKPHKVGLLVPTLWQLLAGQRRERSELPDLRQARRRRIGDNVQAERWEGRGSTGVGPRDASRARKGHPC